MISLILIAMVVSLGLLESWYAVFFHGTTPMFTCSTCGHGNLRGGNCTLCEIEREKAIKVREESDRLRRAAKYGSITHDILTVSPTRSLLTNALRSRDEYWKVEEKVNTHCRAANVGSHCTCGGSIKYACQYCLNLLEVVE